MFKALFAFSLLLTFALLGGALLLPLLALLPLVLAIGIGVAVLALVFGTLGFVLRLLVGLTFGLGGLLVAVFGLGLLFIGGALLFALGAIAVHLLIPLLFVFGLIWLIRHFARPAPLRIGHDPA